MKILIADDEPMSRRVLETMLGKWGYDVVVARDGTEAWQILQSEDSPQLAIMDWMMPGMDGVEVCREVRKRGESPYVYVLLLTMKAQRTDVMQGMAAGADDYLVKPFDLRELKVRLRAGRRILTLQEELLAAREAIRFRVQATHDFLTGLYNRGAILDILQRELARGERERTPVGVLLADLDHFKKINDTHGHLTGDTVLREVAHRIRSSLRPYDASGRYGGEEFLIVSPASDLANTIRQGERLCAAVGATPIETFEGPVPVTMSLGVATTDGAGAADIQRLITAADAALYRAKHKGRNRVECGPAEEGMGSGRSSGSGSCVVASSA